MSEKLGGRRGELLRIGLAARNWLLSQIPEDEKLLDFRISEESRSARDIVEHVATTVLFTCGKLAEELGVDIKTLSSDEDPTRTEDLVSHCYRVYKELLYSIEDGVLERWSTLPPPARLREGSVETILRIIAAYHTFHHAGQVALLIGEAKRNL